RVTQLQGNLAPAGRDALNTGDAWKVISESAEFRGLLATGASLLQGVLSTVVPQERGNGHAPLSARWMCLGIPGRVVEMVDPDNGIAKADVNGVRRNVSVQLLQGDGGVAVG